MDPLYYARIAMSGWIFLAILLLSFWETNSYQWQQIVSLANKDQATLVLAVFGAIVGFGGPPAFGFLLEKIVSVILVTFKQNMWQYKSVRTFKINYDSLLTDTNNTSLTSSDSSIFHTLFYSQADEKLLDWARRRRTHMFASFTGAASIILAWLLAYCKYDVVGFCTTLISIVLLVGLFIHGFRELKYHRKTISAWIEMYGKNVCNEVLKGKSI